jgi:hypothetical protein
MIVNFKIYKINWDTYKLTRILILKKIVYEKSAVIIERIIVIIIIIKSNSHI